MMASGEPQQLGTVLQKIALADTANEDLSALRYETTQISFTRDHSHRSFESYHQRLSSASQSFLARSPIRLLYSQAEEEIPQRRVS